ncbi:MAG: CatB-related O-acetyltransferase [Acidimicrobiales bacterium]
MALPQGVSVGPYTYGHTESTFWVFLATARIEVGAFCSIGPEVRILAGSEHIMTRPTTFPLDALIFNPAAGNAGDGFDKGTTVIGHDVWVGLGATVLSGVLVGDGAVIGAGAVVSKWVPPYAVVAGNPAEILRYRFDAQNRRRLLALGWWHWKEEDICALRDRFVGDVESFLDAAERAHGPMAESELARRLREAHPEMLTPSRGTNAPGGEAASNDAAGRIYELEAQITRIRATRAWRWATRYWTLRERLRGHIGSVR